MVGTQKDEFLHVGFITSLSIIDSHRGAVCLLLNMIKMFMSGLSFIREILLSKRERERERERDWVITMPLITSFN